ncbi:MAG: NrdH-redoxin [Candidatus Cloacimonadota bacterium]|nr:MAG: NrdH-redoxin [Candidatus Cloacimonadota bacterium]
MSNKKTHKVIVFSTPTCSWCRRTKQYLKEKGISFKEIDVSKNQQAANDIMRRTGQTGVPIILIDNRPVVGFNKSVIDRLLGIKADSKQ